MRIIITEEQKNKLFQINEVRVKESDRVKIYEDDKILVVAPLTHRASCKYGANTPWCVAVPGTDEHFNEYSDNGILLYFIIKSPYEYGDIKEYKFAYYKPFNDEMDEYSGWYDMSDYKYGNEDKKESDEIVPDIRLLKFLIPKKVMGVVFNYIKEQTPIYKKKLLDKKKKILDIIYNDPDNHMIYDDKDWFIMYRNERFGNKYNSYDWFPEPRKDYELFVIYGNKVNYELYRQEIPYYIDIRTYKQTKARLPQILSLNNHDIKPDIMDIFKNHFKKIALTFFKERKENFKPNDYDYMYLHPKYVEIGDIYNVSGARGYDAPKIIKKEPITGSYKPYRIDVQYPSGEINKDVYYSEDLGLGLKYDKEKHNPTNI